MAKSSVASVLLVALLLVATAQAAPVNSCALQKGCLSGTIEEMDYGNTCNIGECEFKVCLTFNTAKSGCEKKGDKISHTCGFNEEKCVDKVLGTVVTSPIQKPPVSFQQCQTGVTGTTLSFYYKDGSDCDGTDTLVLALTGRSSPVSVGCKKKDGKVSGCGNNQDKCVWSVTLPDCEAAVEMGRKLFM